MLNSNDEIKQNSKIDWGAHKLNLHDKIVHNRSFVAKDALPSKRTSSEFQVALNCKVFIFYYEF